MAFVGLPFEFSSSLLHQVYGTMVIVTGMRRAQDEPDKARWCVFKYGDPVVTWYSSTATAKIAIEGEWAHDEDEDGPEAA